MGSSAVPAMANDPGHKGAMDWGGALFALLAADLRFDGPSRIYRTAITTW